MKTATVLLTLGFLAAFALPAAAATTPPAGALAAINGFVAATNLNNAAKVQSYLTSDAVVVDESAPFIWRGARAGTAWWTHIQSRLRGAALSASASAPTEFNTDPAGSSAYAVVPMRISVSAKGKTHLETGLLAMTLRRTGSVWKITTVSWATLQR